MYVWEETAIMDVSGSYRAHEGTVGRVGEQQCVREIERRSEREF
jgi:hypothetical protein